MKKSRNGFTVVEVVVALALTAIIGYGIVSGTVSLFKTEGRTGNISDESKLIQSVIENISADPASYQKNFSPDAINNIETILAPDKLPLGFGPEYFGPRDGCNTPTKCKAFMGFVIRPLIGARGLFEVNLKVAKPKLDAKGYPMVPAAYETTDYVFVTQSN